MAKNGGDIIVGGERYSAPWVMRLDSIGNVKWTAWYFDSTKGESLFYRFGCINSLKETSTGQIICAIGERIPEATNNYAAFLAYDSSGNMVGRREWDTETGPKMGGFSIEEVSVDFYYLAGNQCVLGIDSLGNTIFKRDYTFSLDGVGSVTNDVMRVKKLRDGTEMVIGRAYQENCWRRFKEYVYDAWWAPVSAAGAGSTDWFTRGEATREDDRLFDFAQLADGRLVFVGQNEQIITETWIFVTDSTGANVLWEKRVEFGYKNDIDTNDIKTYPIVYSVCGTPDSGFTVAGVLGCEKGLGGQNGLLAHFVPSATPVTLENTVKESTVKDVSLIRSGSKVRFVLPNQFKNRAKITITNASGKCIAILSDQKTDALVWDISKFSSGIYFYKVKSGSLMASGKVIVN